MNRKMLGILLTGALAIGFAGSATAGTFDPANSYLSLKIGAVPLITVPAGASAVTLTDNGGGGHIITEASSLFQTTNHWVNSAAFTGLPSLTGLKISLHSGSGSFADGFSVPNSVGNGVIGTFGGYEGVTGTAVLVAGGFSVAIDLSVLGNGGTVTADILNNTVVVTGEPYGTGQVTITGVSSNLVYVPGRGVTGVAFTLNLTTVELVSATEVTSLGAVLTQTTAKVTGANNLNSASSDGSVTLVSPMRLKTGNLAGNVTGAVTKHFEFVPEPGTMLLLVAGAAGLAVIGRNRMRK